MDKKKRHINLKRNFNFFIEKLKKTDSKKVILSIITIILFVLVFVLANMVFYKYLLKRNFENSVIPFSSKNEHTVFEIKNITFFSSCECKK